MMETRSVYRILVGKYVRKYPLGKPRRIWKNKHFNKRNHTQV
jgi:hypothetical protein